MPRCKGEKRVERKPPESGNRVWLIAPDGRLRALLRAQLLEDDLQVIAMRDWNDLEALLSDKVMAPHLLIAELTGDEPPAALSLLCAMPVRRLVLRTTGAPATDSLRAAGIDAVLSRPFSVDDVRRGVRALIRRV